MKSYNHILSNRATLLLIVLLLSMQSFAQFTTVMDMPRKYLYPIDTITRPYPNEAVCKDTLWYVYSDRADNPIFAEQDINSETVIIADFLDEFVVLEVKKNWVKVTKSENVYWIIWGYQLLPMAKIGWINYHKLILSSYSLRAEKTNQNRKGFVLNTLDYKVKHTSQIYYYDQPSMDSNYKLHSPESFQVRFIYKVNRDSTFFLVGKQAIINGQYYPDHNKNIKPSLVIEGWIPKENFIPWNNRVAWELNWHIKARRSREWNDQIDNVDKGNIIFKTAKGANQYSIEDPQFVYRLPQRYIIETEDIYRTREEGILNRFPLIFDSKASSCKPDSAKKVGIVLPIGLGQNRDRLTNKDINITEFKKEIIAIEEGLKITNVVFIIDASESAIDYKDVITEALGKTIERLKNDTARIGHILKIGMVLFRDEVEDRRFDIFNDGKLIDIRIDTTRKHNETTRKSINTIFQWINTCWTSKSNKNDRDLPEALYYGINIALDKYALNEKGSNYLIIIGDAGDHCNPKKSTTYVKESILIEKLAKHNVNILAYQVRRGQHKTYDDFARQIKRIIERTDSLVYAKIIRNPLPNEKEKIKYGELDSISNGISRGYRLNNNCLLKSQLLFLHEFDKTTISDKLKTDISENIINTIYLSVNGKIHDIAEVLTDSLKISRYESSSTALMIYEILKNDTSFEKTESLYIPQKFEYLTGFTTFRNKIQDSVYPMFQPVVLMDERQLIKTKDIFSSLSSVNKTKGLRVQLRDAVIEMVLCFIGDYQVNYENKEIGKMLYCMSMFKIKDKYYNWKIKDIADPASGIPLDDIKAMKDDLIHSSEILKNIIAVGNSYPAKIKHIGIDNSLVVFWWIPTDVFPHQSKSDDVTNSWF